MKKKERFFLMFIMKIIFLIYFHNPRKFEFGSKNENKQKNKEVVAKIRPENV